MDIEFYLITIKCLFFLSIENHFKDTPEKANVFIIRSNKEMNIKL